MFSHRDLIVLLHSTFGLILQVVKVEKHNLQLVGVTALLIASKCLIFAPEVKDIVYITDYTYSVEQISKMERKMLRELNYRLGNPLALDFFRENSKAAYVRMYMAVHSLDTVIL